MFSNYSFPLQSVTQLSHTDKAYSQSAAALQEFYNYNVHIDNFKQIIDIKKQHYSDEIRQILYDVFLSQYKSISNNNNALNAINLLSKSNTFTVCTAHQPLLFTGAFYFIYKIAAAIKTTIQLSAAYPDCNFIPIYWIGSEDHDFEELNHCFLFNKKISWTDEQGGAVGNYNLNNFQQVIDELQLILGTSTDYNFIINLIKNTYTVDLSYAQATFKFVNELFKHTNLLILDQNDPNLKQICLPIFKDDILNNSSFNIINQTTELLNQKGFKTQATPRPINLFYLLPNKRERIIFENNQYKILNTDIIIEKDNIIAFIEQNYTQLSANVILRPLMQETVLPNLAYIGGGGEIAYWLERKAQFDYYKIPLPMLIRRPSCLFIDKSTNEKLLKFNFSIEFWFENVDTITKQFLLNNTDEDISLEQERDAIKAIYNNINVLYPKAATTLSNAIQSQLTTTLNGLNTLSDKMRRELKRLDTENVAQIAKIKEKLFPNGGLQERQQNFISLFAKYGTYIFDFLIANFEPLNNRFYVFTE